MLRKILKLYKRQGLPLREWVPLAEYTTLKVGGPARLMVEPRDCEDLFWAASIAEALGIPTLFLGKGSNLLVREGGFPGIVINLRNLKRIKYLGSGEIEAGAGVSVSALLGICVHKGLSGLEFLAGVPATVGGIVAMNAGAFGQEIKDCLKSLLIFHRGRFRDCSAQEFSFTYRLWRGPEKALIVKAVFTLKLTSSREVEKRIRENLSYRRKTQPLKAFTAGCVFKNPSEAPAGYLLEKVGLKGFSLGGAYFSEKHANFIVNRGDAKAREILALIDKAKERVFKAYGIELAEEVSIVGEG